MRNTWKILTRKAASFVLEDLQFLTQHALSYKYHSSTVHSQKKQLTPLYKQLTPLYNTLRWHCQSPCQLPWFSWRIFNSWHSMHCHTNIFHQQQFVEMFRNYMFSSIVRKNDSCHNRTCWIYADLNGSIKIKFPVLIPILGRIRIMVRMQSIRFLIFYKTLF